MTAQIYPGNGWSTTSSPSSHAHVANSRWAGACTNVSDAFKAHATTPLADQDGLNVQPTLSVPTELLIRWTANERSKDTVNDAIDKNDGKTSHESIADGSSIARSADISHWATRRMINANADSLINWLFHLTSSPSFRCLSGIYEWCVFNQLRCGDWELLCFHNNLDPCQV